MSTELQLQSSQSKGHGGHFPGDLGHEPPGGDGDAGPLDHTVLLVPGPL